MAKQQETAVAVQEFKALAIPAAQLTKFLLENVGSQGLRPQDLDRVKVPAGGGSTWEVPTLTGPEPVKVLDGIILHFKDVRAYWKSKGTGNAPPDCSSPDGVVGIGAPGGSCHSCPLSQFGTALDERGQAAKGQACKAMRLLLFLRQDDMLPLLVTLPPTSIQAAKKYFLRLVANGQPYYGVTTQLRLEQQKNAAGTNYSVATLSMGRVLTPAEAEKVTLIGQAMRDLFATTSALEPEVHPV